MGKRYTTGFMAHHKNYRLVCTHTCHGYVCAGTGAGWDFPTCGLPMMNPNVTLDTSARLKL